jgi:hypothetical protein
LNSKLLAVSNNPLVWEHLDGRCRRVEGNALHVLYTGLHLLGAGGCLLYAHPVAGNARLLRNPYRTIVLEEGKPSREKLHKHLGILEHFIRKLEAPNASALACATEDYRSVDYSLFQALWPSPAG